MKFLAQTLIILFTATLVQSFFPWWTVTSAAFGVSAWLGRSGLSSFFAGFLAIFLLWSGYALIIDIQSGGTLTERVANILIIGDKYLLILATGLIAGLVGGVSAVAGYHLNRIFNHKNTKKYYS